MLKGGKKRPLILKTPVMVDDRSPLPGCTELVHESRSGTMKFKHRIWMLPIMTAVIVTIGIAISSSITAKTSAALVKVEQVQYPTVEALRSVQEQVTNIEESLQRAVAEGDKQSVASAGEHAAAV